MNDRWNGPGLRTAIESYDTFVGFCENDDERETLTRVVNRMKSPREKQYIIEIGKPISQLVKEKVK